MLRWFSAAVPLEPAGARRRRNELLGWLGVVVAVALVHARMGGTPIFPVDDAYITLHNVRVLLAGSDPNFPGISPFSGATSPVHLLFVAALALFVQAPWALWLAGWLATAFYAAGVLRLAVVLEAPRAVALALPFVALTCGGTSVQLMNGLETGLAMAAVVWSIAIHLDPEATRRRWLPAVLGMLPFLRPELTLLSAALLTDRVLGETSWRARARRFALDAALAAVFAAPLCLLNVFTSGGVIPATVSIKQYYFAEGCKPLGWRTSTVESAVSGFLERTGFAAVGLALLVLKRCGRFLLLAVAGIVASYWAQFPGALTHFEHRYLHVLVPLAIFGLAIAAADRQGAMRRWGLIFVAFSIVNAAVTLPSALGAYRQHLEKDTLESAEVSQFISRQIAGTPRLLAHDIGYLSNALPNEIVDLVGLKNPLAAALHRAATWRTCGDARVLVFQQLALESEASYLVVLDDWETIYRIAKGFRALRWRVEPLRPAGVRYQIYRLTPPPNPLRSPLNRKPTSSPPGAR
jgi:hypothetical protein